MRLSKGNDLTIKSTAHTLYNGPPDKGGIIQRVSCLIRQEGIRLTDGYQRWCLPTRILSYSYWLLVKKPLRIQLVSFEIYQEKKQKRSKVITLKGAIELNIAFYSKSDRKKTIS